MNGLTRHLACFYIDVGDTDVGGRKDVENLFAPIGLLEHLDGDLRIKLGLLVENHQPIHKPVEHWV